MSTEDRTELLRSVLAEEFVILKEIGRGGMATVFLADQLHPSRKVAIKVLDPEIAPLLARRRFLKEVELTGSLAHPHILPIFSAGQSGGFLYYVMPYVAGESLRHHLMRHGPLDVANALRIGYEVADALQFAHDQGIVHRDVKPENILLADGHALVADFGIARAFTEAGSEQLTQAGLALGTPSYMSPEQAQGARDLGPKTDIYSLACVIFEALSGQAPYVGATPREVMEQHTSARIPKIRGARGPVPPTAVEALRTSMAKDPGDRLNTASELSGVLKSACRDLRGRRPHRPRMRLYLGFAAIVSLLGIAAIWRIAGLGESDMDLAIATLENRTEVPALDSLGPGLAEELQTVIRDEFTHRTTTAFTYRGSGLDRLLLERARELGAETLIAGSYHLETDSLEFVFEVVDVSGERILSLVSPPPLSRDLSVREIARRLSVELLAALDSVVVD